MVAVVPRTGAEPPAVVAGATGADVGLTDATAPVNDAGPRVATIAAAVLKMFGDSAIPGLKTKRNHSKVISKYDHCIISLKSRFIQSHL